MRRNTYQYHAISARYGKPSESNKKEKENKYFVIQISLHPFLLFSSFDISVHSLEMTNLNWRSDTNIL